MAEPEYDTFLTTIAAFPATLATHGVAVIPGIIPIDQSQGINCDTIYSKQWDFYEHITATMTVPINRHQPATWDTFYQLYPGHSMLVQYYGVGHAQFAWDVRQHPAVVDVYAKIWSCQPHELLASFDGSSLHLPPELTGKGWWKGKDWLHVDQSYQRNGLECIQSFVSLLDTRPGDAALTILEGSHLLHGEVATRFGLTDPGDFGKLQTEHIEYYLARGCRYRRVACSAGSMVLWDSRTVHCGSEPLQSRAQPNVRSVVYVCYQPRAHATPKQLEKKREAFRNLRTTTHWPIKSKLFGKQPNTYGKPLPHLQPITYPNLTELGQKLAGF